MNQQLLELAKKQSFDLLCETHPNVCSIRDEDVDQLMVKVEQVIISHNEPISIQTAFAELEGILAETK